MDCYGIWGITEFGMIIDWHGKWHTYVRVKTGQDKVVWVEWNAELKKALSGHLGQVDFLKATCSNFSCLLASPRQVVCQLKT